MKAKPSRRPSAAGDGRGVPLRLTSLKALQPPAKESTMLIEAIMVTMCCVGGTISIVSLIAGLLADR